MRTRKSDILHAAREFDFIIVSKEIENLINLIILLKYFQYVTPAFKIKFKIFILILINRTH